ncbi:hypothetical protein Tco_0303067 [Tanacetum coccineum]
MLAPSSGGLILYLAYSNLYAMTGRKAYLLEDKQIPSVGYLMSTWMAFRVNTRDLGSFGEETYEITDLHQILKEVLLIERGDGVAGIKRRRRDPSSDDVRDLVTASGYDKGKGKRIMKDTKQNLIGIKELDDLEERINNVEAVLFKLRDIRLRQKDDDTSLDAPVIADNDSFSDSSNDLYDYMSEEEPKPLDVPK